MLADFVSQHLPALEFCLGALLVFLLTIRRFGNPPPQWEVPTVDHDAPNLGFVDRILKRSHALRPDPDIYLPVSSNTTRWKFLRFAAYYGFVGVAIYWTFLLFPTLGKHTPAFLEKLGVPSNIAQLISIPSLLIQAFVIAFVLPSILPLKSLDEEIRNHFYQWALIPAQLRDLTKRLIRAPFGVSASVLNMVSKILEPEGFDPEDIVYESDPTARSLWTKASVLFYLIEELGSHPEDRRSGIEFRDAQPIKTRYAKAFSLLKDPGTGQRSMDVLRARYVAVLGQARQYFKKIRQRSAINVSGEDGAPSHLGSDDQETEQFRAECKGLLKKIYHFISRLSLFSHRTDYERVARLNTLGFRLKQQIGGPAPTLDELITSLVLLVFLTGPPLYFIIGSVHGPLMIDVIFLAVALTPILIARSRPRLAIQPARGRYFVFPLLSGFIAFGIGSGVSVAVIGFQTFWMAAWTWMLLVFVTTFTLAILMRVGTYPENLDDLKGLGRLPAYGSVKDCAVLTFVVAMMTVVVIYIKRVYLKPQFPEINVPPLSLAVPAMSLFGVFIGFFVPTWFRANIAREHERLREEREQVIPQVPAHVN